MVKMTWTPSAAQYGPQGFCIGAIDSSYIQSDSWCVTYLVGILAPSLQSPNLVPGSGFPVGTVASNHSLFYVRSKCRYIFFFLV